MEPVKMRRGEKPYRFRNRCLSALGYDSYESYLDSCLWSGLRRTVYERDRYSCQSCGDKADAVHHVEYTWENLSGRSVDGMVAICRTCHSLIEFDERGKKRFFSGKAELSFVTNPGPATRKKRTRCLPEKKSKSQLRRERKAAKKAAFEEVLRHQHLCSRCKKNLLRKGSSDMGVCPPCRRASRLVAVPSTIKS